MSERDDLAWWQARVRATGWDQDDKGCWIWRGAMQNGRPVTGTARVRRTVHRIVHEMHFGVLDDGMTVRRSCGVDRCVNPGHLTATRDRAAREPRELLYPRACSHCGVPQSFDAFTTYKLQRSRECLACIERRSARWRSKNPEAVRATWTRKNAQPEVSAYKVRHATKQNDASRISAKNNGKEWTSAELAVVARHDLSYKQIAEMLGRTLAAVNGQRTKMHRGDPKTLSKLGYDPEKNDGL